jgi:hypothetical protein
MKKMQPVWTFAGGTLLGVALMFCLGADKDAAPAKADKPPLQIVAYSSGATGIFNPDTGTLYLYDANLQNCFLTRKIGVLGRPLINP